jgi:apolipoprotein N-acyltransferase
MKRFFIKDMFFPLISGILFIPGWYEWGSGLTLFIAFVPLLLLMERNYASKKSTRRFVLLSGVAFLIWNIGDTWWIRNALVDGKPSYAGVSAAVMVSTVFMSVAIWLIYMVRVAYGRLPGIVGLVIFWIAFEFSYTHGEISWPWLTLGNGFAYDIKLIQWYEYTGVFGGSLWVLVGNILIYLSLFNRNGRLTFAWKGSVATVLWIVVPILFSLSIFNHYAEAKNPVRIVVVQPNINPYLKFNDISPLEQTKIQIDLAKGLVDSTTDYVVGPETSIIDDIWLEDMESVRDFKMIREFRDQYPNLRFVTGIMCYQLYGPNEPRSNNANPYENGYYYDSYNSAIQIDSTDSIQVYHKSKLVIGVEKMPYPGLLKILKPITMRLGGTFRSHNTQKERVAFFTPGDTLKVGVPICYESVYGEFVTEFVKKGANLIFVITNDGWWGDTPGYRQHNSLSSIRAIETRRSIARSANTGKSSFINQKGQVLQAIGWWKRSAMAETLNANNRLTFYVKYGDYIGRIAFFTAILMVLSLLVRKLKEKNSARKNS